MSAKPALLFLATAIGIASAAAVQADGGDWKRGRVYYRQVCTSCHLSAANKTISPAEKAKAEWSVYLESDQHDASGNSNHSVRYYISQDYRATIADSNKAAEKFLEVPNDDLQADVKAFVLYGAKDSDNPARCQ